MTLNPDVRELCKAPNFAVITSILPSGRAQSHVMWVDCDEESILMNTEVHRRKFLNIEERPQVTVTVWDLDNPYKFGEVRGTVVKTIKGPEARAHIDFLAQKYTGQAYNDQSITSERVILVISPETQHFRG
ncbi:MAG: pyridoxamine 5'-phosphate oxidase family protein [Actinomycetota bacterium]